MKLLLVSDTFTPDVNGVARTLQTLTRALQSRGHEVDVVTTIEGGEGDGGRQIVSSLPLPGYDGLRIGWLTRRRAEEMIRNSAPDVIYVATESPLGVAVIRAGARLGVPVVSGFHTNFQQYLEDYNLPGLEPFAQFVLSTIHNHSLRTLTPSSDSAAALRDWGVANVGVLGRGVDTEVFDPSRRSETLRSSWGADDATPVAIYVGRMAAEKNLDLAARCFRRMRQERPDLVGVFVGDGPRAAAVKEEYPEFVYAGARHGEDLAAHYASGDVFVFPSMTETFGNVVLESMASGLVSVGFDYAAPRLLVDHERNGWLAPMGDEARFEACTLEALDHWNDEEVRTRARATASQHSWKRVVDQFENELTQTIPTPVLHAA